MKNQSAFSIKQRTKSLKHALNGLFTLLLNEANARIHFVIGFVTIVISFLANLNSTEWLFIIIAIGLVCFAEAVNTSIEYLCDVVAPKKNSQVKVAKDVAAASVLIAAIQAALIGSIILIPKILNFL